MTTTTTGPRSILDILEESDVLTYLCCNCLEPKDVLSLEMVSKKTKALIDNNADIWYGFSLKYAGQEIPDNLPPGLSPKEIFLHLLSSSK